MAVTYNLPVDVVLFSFILAVLLYYYFVKDFNYWKKRNVPFVKPVPFFGSFRNFFLMKQNIGQALWEMYEANKKPFLGAFMMNRPCLIVCDPELVKAMLVKDFQYFDDRQVITHKESDPIGAHMLFFLKNPEWKATRQKISAIFTAGKLRQMLQHMLVTSTQMQSYIQKCIDEGNAEIQTKELYGSYATDLITSCAFGINSNSFLDSKSEFRVAAKRLFDYKDIKHAFSMSCVFIAPTLAKLLKLKFVEGRSGIFLRDVFWKTMKERESGGYIRNDLLDLLIKLKKENAENANKDVDLNENLLLSQAVQFFVAGFETTSVTAALTLYELALNHYIQDRVRREVKSTIEKHGSCTYDALKDMTYLDMVLKESLRKYPTLPFLDRTCKQNYQLPGSSVTVEKGMSILIPMWAFHNDPRYFPDPEKFDPERFSVENQGSIQPFTYFPFGEGPRNCVGARFGQLAAKLALVHTLLKFKVEPCSETPKKLVYDAFSVTISPSVSLQLKFIKI